MPSPIDNLDYDLLSADGGGDYFPKFVGMLSKLKELVTLYNATIVDEDSIAAQIADLQVFLEDYEGVASVNGKTGAAVLTASDVGALALLGKADDSFRIGGVVAENVYSTANPPTKSVVGLSNVPNDNPIVTVIDPATSTITRTAIVTNIIRLSAADVTYTLSAAGFSVGDKVNITKAASGGLITVTTSTGSITLVKKATSAASQTMAKCGTICFERTASGWLARAA